MVAVALYIAIGFVISYWFKG
jgi:Na+/proline symporter